jgi:hypothetical protein
MSEEGFTPDTDYVRGAYAGAQIDHQFVVIPEYGAEFDRWLAKLEQAAFDRGIMHGAKHGAQSSLWTTH